MKRIMSLFFALLIATTLSLDLGAETKEKKRHGTPEKSVFVFGIIFGTVRFTQIDPAFEPAYYESSKGVYRFDNVEPGSYLKLTMFEYGTPDNVWITYFLGLTGKSALDFRVPDKPGLYYAGALRFSEVKNNILYFQPYFNPEKYNELCALKWILTSLTHSPWRPVVENRIKELENAGK